MLTNNEKDSPEFRISVCMKQYFSDERSRCYISVSRRQRVEWLHQRLRQLFALEGYFCLVSRGHLLPYEESLAVLQPDDPVDVIPLQNEWYKKCHNETDIIENQELNESQDYKQMRKKKKHMSKNDDKTYNCDVLDGVTKARPLSATLKSNHSININDGDTDLNSTNNSLDVLVDDPLKEFKQKALTLLDKYYVKDLITNPKPAPKTDQVSNLDLELGPLRKRRRRVRRRVRRSEVPTGEQCNLPSQDCSNLSAVDTTTTDLLSSTVIPDSNPTAAQVLRNSSTLNRLARLVRTLSPTTPSHCVTQPDATEVH